MGRSAVDDDKNPVLVADAIVADATNFAARAGRIEPIVRDRKGYRASGLVL